MDGMKKTGKFVIQRHERQGEAVHWDLMLEKKGILETYRVNVPPEEWGNRQVAAAKIFDHPLKFLTYEGPVNKGKGSVSITDSGTYLPLTHSQNHLKLELSGEVMKDEFIFSIGGGRARRE